MKIQREYVLRLSADEFHTVELALWQLVRTAKNQALVEKALELYDRFAGLARAPSSRGGGR